MTVGTRGAPLEELFGGDGYAGAIVVDVDGEAVFCRSRVDRNCAVGVSHRVVDEDVENVPCCDGRDVWGAQRGLGADAEWPSLVGEASMPMVFEFVEHRRHVEWGSGVRGVACQGEQLDDRRFQAICLLDRVLDCFVFRSAGDFGGFEDRMRLLGKLPIHRRPDSRRRARASSATSNSSGPLSSSRSISHTHERALLAPSTWRASTDVDQLPAPALSESSQFTVPPRDRESSCPRRPLTEPPFAASTHARDHLRTHLTLLRGSEPRRSWPTRDYLRPLLVLRALDRCFLPGGPPELPRGMLLSPGFLSFAITASLRHDYPPRTRAATASRRNL